MQEGCDKFCTYCVVPYTRGAEISRPFADLIAEARALVAGGVREITLLGQNVNAWDGEDDKGRAIGLDGLIRELAKEDGLERIRYTTSHPNDMTDGLIAAHGEVDKLMPFLHLPVQAGSDRILAAMNRSHSVESYLKVIERVRAVRPDIAISGDFIVGFPGETERRFRGDARYRPRHQLCDGVQLQIFAPSRHPRRRWTIEIDEAVLNDRLQRLQALLNEQQQAFNQATVGRRRACSSNARASSMASFIGKSPAAASRCTSPRRGSRSAT